MVSAWVGVGILCCVFLVLYFCVWPGMVPSQMQLSIVVSDWEPYLGNLFSQYGLWVVVFCVLPYRIVLVFIYFSFFCVRLYFIKIWTLTMLRIGLIFPTPPQRRKTVTHTLQLRFRTPTHSRVYLYYFLHCIIVKTSKLWNNTWNHVVNKSVKSKYISDSSK
jgi:hypothetical protein